MRQDDLAGTLGTTQSSVSGWVHGKYEPAAATVFAIERCLGAEPGSLSRPLGYLPVEPAVLAVSVEVAIAQSKQLDDEAKDALVALYRVLVMRSTGAERPLNQPAGANRSPVAAAPATQARTRSVTGGR